MASYAWKIGSWKAGALKSGSWGPEAASSAPGLSGVPSFTTFSAAPTTALVLTTVTFTFSVSGNTTGPVYIDTDSDGDFDVIVTAGNSASYVYPVAGTYTAMAVVSGPDGNATATFSPITITGSSVPEFTTFSASPTTGTTSTPITFTFSVSGSTDGPVRIDPQGDGSYEVVVTAGQSATFTYASAGNFTAFALVSGPGGNASISFGTISINLAPDPGPSFAGGGRSGLRFATLDGGGLGGLRSNKSLLVFGLKRRT